MSQGTTVGQPAQEQGGRLNSTLLVVLPGGPLAPGTSVNVQFSLGVQTGGSFRFIGNVEALPNPASVARPARAGKLSVTK